MRDWVNLRILQELFDLRVVPVLDSFFVYKVFLNGSVLVNLESMRVECVFSFVTRDVMNNSI